MRPARSRGARPWGPLRTPTLPSPAVALGDRPAGLTHAAGEERGIDPGVHDTPAGAPRCPASRGEPLSPATRARDLDAGAPRGPASRGEPRGPAIRGEPLSPAMRSGSSSSLPRRPCETPGRAPRTTAGEGRGGGRLVVALAACLLLVPAPVVAAPEPRSPAEVAAGVDALLPWTGRAAPACDDAAFVRRLTLDLHGTLPAPAAAKAFVADRAPGKRARLAEALARDPAFARRFAELLGRGWLEGSLPDDDGGRFLRAELTGWLERELAADHGLDGVVAELIAAEGTTDERPATIYAFAHGRDDLVDLAARRPATSWAPSSAAPAATIIPSRPRSRPTSTRWRRTSSGPGSGPSRAAWASTA